MRFLCFCLVFTLLSCHGQDQENSSLSGNTDPGTDSNNVRRYFLKNKDDEQVSISKGTVSKGSLENGKLLPFTGSNFQYFDTTSYLSGRAFVNNRLKKTLLETYEQMAGQVPGRQFFIMECSNKSGGQIFPHRTHQNGLSVDFMMPVVKEGKPFYGLDKVGKDHYWLDFDNKGRYGKDSTLSIDFEMVARHILLLDKIARVNGLKVSKVIVKIELKDELYAGVFGRKLRESKIYLAQELSPLINSLHDDHYHIDFEQIK